MACFIQFDFAVSAALCSLSPSSLNCQPPPVSSCSLKSIRAFEPWTLLSPGTLNIKADRGFCFMGFEVRLFSFRVAMSKGWVEWERNITGQNLVPNLRKWLGTEKKGLLQCSAAWNKGLVWGGLYLWVLLSISFSFKGPSVTLQIVNP